MNIAGVIKDWMLIFFSWSVFLAPVTALNLLGYAFCCSGVRLEAAGGMLIWRLSVYPPGILLLGDEAKRMPQGRWTSWDT